MELTAANYGEGLEIFYRATEYAGLVAIYPQWLLIQVHADSMQIFLMAAYTAIHKNLKLAHYSYRFPLYKFNWSCLNGNQIRALHSVTWSSMVLTSIKKVQLMKSPPKNIQQKRSAIARLKMQYSPSQSGFPYNWSWSLYKELWLRYLPAFHLWFMHWAYLSSCYEKGFCSGSGYI